MPGIKTGLGVGVQVRIGARLNPLEYAQFIAATGITDAIQKAATLKLVKDFKSANVWDKMPVIYPMIGGTSQAHKFNLKDSRDLDAAFRLNFTTGWTHTATGAKPNGVSAYADTFYNLLLNGQQNSLSFGYYSRTHIIGSQVEMSACQTIGGQKGSYLIFNYNNSPWKCFNSAESLSGTSVNPTTGLVIANRNSETREKYYHNGIIIDDLAVDSIPPVNGTVLLGFMQGTTYYSSKECAFSFIGDGLTDTDALNIYNAINLFQTTLGRTV